MAEMTLTIPFLQTAQKKLVAATKKKSLRHFNDLVGNPLKISIRL
jgi:hypothetical protein